MKKSLFKNIIYKVILNTFNLIIPIMVGPYVNRALGPDSIGKVQFAESIFNYFFIFAVFGIYQYGLREISRIKDDEKKVSQLFTSLFLISLTTGIVSLITYLAFCYVGYNDHIIFPILLVFGFNFIFNIFYVEWVNEALENYDFITVKTVIVRSIYVVLIFLFVNHSSDYQHYAILLVFFMFLNNVISFFYIKRKIKFDFSNIKVKKHLKPLFIVVIFSNASVLYTQLDRYMLGEFVSTKSVAFYVIPQQIMGIINTLILSVVQVTIPRLTYILSSDDDEAYLTLLTNISKVFFAFLFPAAVGLYVLSDIAVIIYGDIEFINAAPVLSVFTVYMILLGIESIFTNQIIYVKKKEHILIRFVFLSGVLNLLLNILLLHLRVFTPMTAIVTTTVAQSVLLVLEYIYIRRFLKVRFTLFEVGKIKYFFYALLFIPVSLFIRQFVSGLVPLFLLIITVNSLLYGAILLLTKDIVVKMFIDKIKNRGMGKKSQN